MKDRFFNEIKVGDIVYIIFESKLQIGFVQKVSDKSILADTVRMWHTDDSQWQFDEPRWVRPQRIKKRFLYIVCKK